MLALAYNNLTVMGYKVPMNQKETHIHIDDAIANATEDRDWDKVKELTNDRNRLIRRGEYRGKGMKRL